MVGEEVGGSSDVIPGSQVAQCNREFVADWRARPWNREGYLGEVDVYEELTGLLFYWVDLNLLQTRVTHLPSRCKPGTASMTSSDPEQTLIQQEPKWLRLYTSTVIQEEAHKTSELS